MIGITSDADVAKEFVDINQYASRATWSNCNSAAQNVMIDICSDSAKVARLDAERNKYFKQGIRLAVCSVSKEKMKGLAAKLAAAIETAGVKQ